MEKIESKKGDLFRQRDTEKRMETENIRLSNATHVFKMRRIDVLATHHPAKTNGS